MLFCQRLVNPKSGFQTYMTSDWFLVLLWLYGSYSWARSCFREETFNGSAIYHSFFFENCLSVASPSEHARRRLDLHSITCSIWRIHCFSDVQTSTPELLEHPNQNILHGCGYQHGTSNLVIPTWLDATWPVPYRPVFCAKLLFTCFLLSHFHMFRFSSAKTCSLG